MCQAIAVHAMVWELVQYTLNIYTAMNLSTEYITVPMIMPLKGDLTTMTGVLTAMEVSYSNFFVGVLHIQLYIIYT